MGFWMIVGVEAVDDIVVVGVVEDSFMGATAADSVGEDEVLEALCLDGFLRSINAAMGYMCVYGDISSMFGKKSLDSSFTKVSQTWSCGGGASTLSLKLQKWWE